MFKLESYITPFIMGYIDKYVKLKQEDFQLSLWGGDAVLNKLDLRLEAIEQALQLPITFKSGHIHELRIHVPWTKLGSEPVVITINTIECVLKLSDATDDDHSSKSSTTKVAQSKVKVKKPQSADEEDLPPGYLQGYINKIINNVNIVINNLILKFVEDDIVLSVNVKSAELYSVNQNWDRAFIELLQPELVLRRVINFHDLTVCLDKRNASGKIDTYQDPLMYRCSLTCRMHMTYDGLHAKFPCVTKFNVFCDRLELSLTDVQVPMFFRLVELCLAIYYGLLDLSGPSGEEKVKAADIRSHLSSDHNKAAVEAALEESQGWGSWAWSYVPQILPSEGEEDWMEGEKRPKKKEAAIFCLGMYCEKACIVFKLTELVQQHSRFGPHKTAFKPCMRWEAEGISIDVLLKGLEFFNVQFGITSSFIFSEGEAICGVNDIEASTRDPCFFKSGQIQETKPLHFLSYSLFDPESAENLGDRPGFILTQEKHMELYTESFGIQKFGSLFVDYCYVMEKEETDDDKSEDTSNASVTSEGEILGAKENSMMRFIVGPAHLVVSSSMFQRVHKFIHCATDHEYEPYAKTKTETPPASRISPTDEEVKRMEDYIPTRTQHFTLLKPSVLIQANDLPEYDVKKKRTVSHRKAKKKKDNTMQQGPIPPLPAVLFQAERFDLQITSAMFPKKLVTSVSSMTAPSSNLLHHCHKHMYIKLFGLQTGLTVVNEKSQMVALQNLNKPCSGAFYKTTLLLPKYWNNPLQTKSVTMYEVPQVGLNFTKAQAMLAWYVASTWTQAHPNPISIQETSLMNDVFYPQFRPEVKQPALECVLAGIEVKQCYTEATSSVAGTVTAVQVILTSAENDKVVVTPLMSGPVETSKLYETDFFQSESLSQQESQMDLIMFTLQVPTTPSRPQAPSAVFLDIQGIVGILDPRLNDWLKYVPVKKGYSSVLLSPKPNNETANVEDTSPDQELTDSASNQTNPTSAQTTSISQSQSVNQSKSQPVEKGQPYGEVEEETEGEQQACWGNWCAEIFPIIKIMEIQIDTQNICLFLPTHNCDALSTGVGSAHTTSSSVNIAGNLKMLCNAKKLPDTLVVCLPSVRVYSQGHKCLPPVQELPIKMLEHSIAGEKLPWLVEIKNTSIYSIHNSDKIHYLVKPSCLESTIAVSPVYNPPTYDIISSLGIAIHADMKEVVVGLSNQQVQVTYDLIMTEVNVISQLLESLHFIQKFSKPHSTHTSTVSPLCLNNPQPAKQWPPASVSYEELNNKKQSITSESSQIENIEPMGGLENEETTDTGSVLSRIGSPVPEEGSNKVKMSLWLQWTVLKFALRFYSRTERDVKMEMDLEDMSTSVDMGNVYTKINSKIGTFSVHHFSRSTAASPWQLGSFEGILLTKSDAITRNTQTIGTKLWRKSEDKNSPEYDLDEVKPQEKGHSFTTFTFTRASKKSVKKKMQLMNDTERLQVPNVKLNKNAIETSTTYINEVVLNFLPCDIVLNCPVLIGVINVFKVDTQLYSSLDKKSEIKVTAGFKELPKTPTMKEQSDGSDIPYFSSANLPLFYITSSGIRVFIPSIPESSNVLERESSTTALNDSAVASYQKDVPLSSQHNDDIQTNLPVLSEGKLQTPTDETTKQSKTSKVSYGKSEDTFIIELSSFSINPQPMNPLPRNVVDKEMYRKALQSGVLNVPGSELEDRQYQLDVCGWSLSSGHWQKLIHHQEDKKKNTDIQNPALEWNNMTKKWDSDTVKLIPLASSFDLRVTAAPAIVYYPQETDIKKEPTLVCGYSLEMNATSDIEFFVSLHQVKLAHRIFLGNVYPLLWSVIHVGSAGSEIEKTNKPSESKKISEVLHSDSGVESDVQSSQKDAHTTKQNVMETIHEDVDSKDAYVTFEMGDADTSFELEPALTKNFTPLDVLLTAGRISMMVYRHSETGGDFSEKVRSRGSVAKKKSDLDWNTVDESDNNYGKEQLKSPLHPRDDNSTLDSGLPDKDIPQQKRVVPVLYAYFSQPHSLVSVLRNKQKIELSCYDLVLKGGRTAGYIVKDENKIIPEPSDFPSHWIETKPGKPDIKTGIPPSLYTFRISDFLYNPAKIMLNFERPVKLNLSLANIEQISQVSEEVWMDFKGSLPPNMGKSTKASMNQEGKGTSDKNEENVDSERGYEETMKQISKDLIKIGNVKFSTVQILVVLEAADKGNSPKTELSTSNLDVHFSLTPLINKASLSEINGQILVKDLYLTTSLKGNSRPLLGPFPVQMLGKASWCLHSGSQYLPKVTFSLKAGIIEVHLGQAHVLCLLEIVDCFQNFIEKTTKKWKTNIGKQDEPPVKLLPKSKRKKTVKQATTQKTEVSEDDLRSGTLEYVTLETNIDELPNEGEILFSNNFQQGQAGVSWCYKQPRVVTHLGSAPMPLNLPLELEARRVNEDLLVPCILQYWDSLTECYENYTQFTISEHKAFDIALPDVSSDSREDVVASKIWRVLIVRPEERESGDGYVLLDKQSEAGSSATMIEDDEFVLIDKQDNRFIEPLVSPLTLAASLKVTSCFAQHIVPMFQIGLSAQQMKLRLVNHLEHIGKTTPGKLKPFEIVENSVSEHEFMVFKIDNPNLSFSNYQGQEQCIELEVSSEISVDILEHRNLTMVPVCDRVEIDGEIQWTKKGDKQKIKANVFMEPFIFKAGPSVFHTLNIAESCWQQLYTKENYPVSHHYIICNDTQEVIRVGQVDTDEGIVIRCRQALPYAWRTHKNKQLLRLSLERLPWQWCEAVNLDTDATYVRTITKGEHRLCLIIQIQQLTNVQKQISIRGNYIITSRVTHPLDIKLLTTRGTDKVLTLASEATLPSYVLDPQEVKGLKIRLAGQNVLWSQEVAVTGESAKASKLLKIPSQECTSFMHVWCHIFEQKHGSCLQNMIMLVPLFVFRSQLPAPLLMTVDTPRIKTYSPLELEGHNMDTQIHTMGGDMTHNITFQLSHNMKPSKPAIQLSSGMIEQVSTEKLEDVQVCDLSYSWKQKDAIMWPYNDLENKGVSPVTHQSSMAGVSKQQGKAQQETSLSQQQDHGSLSRTSAKYSRDTSDFGENIAMESQPNIDLQVSLSQYWKGCNTLLVDIAPHLLLCNQCDLDLWVIANGETHWKLPAEQTWAPPPFEGSFRLGLVIDHELQLCDQLELSEEDDRAKYLPKIEGLLYVESHINVKIPIKSSDGNVVKMCYLTLHSTKQKNMRILTVKERFAISNNTEKDLFICATDVSLTENKVTVDFANMSRVALTSNKLSKNKKTYHDSIPLLFWDVVEPSSKQLMDDKGVHTSALVECVQYILINCDNQSESCDIKRNQSSSSVFEVDQSECSVINPLLWSCPVRMKLKATGNRQNVCIPVVDRGQWDSFMVTAVSETKDAITYIIVTEETYPQLVVQNNCDFALHFGQTFAEKTIEDATVYEEVEIINKLPILPPNGCTQYTFPSLNSQFSELAEYDKLSLKLHFTACHDLNEQFNEFLHTIQESAERIGLPSVSSEPESLKSQSSTSFEKTENCLHRNNLRWSQGIDVTQGSDCCIYIPGLSDVKVHIEKVGYTTYLYIDPVTRAEISAKEIRSRIKGGEKTVLIETKEKTLPVSSVMKQKSMAASVIEFEEQAEMVGDALHCTDTKHGVLIDVSTNTSSTPKQKKNQKKSKRLSTTKLSIHTPMEIECNFLCKQASLVLLDERLVEVSEALRITIDNVYIYAYPETDIVQLTYHRPYCSYRIINFVGDLQIDNMMQKGGSYDYPVVLIKKEDAGVSHLEKDFVELVKDKKVEFLQKEGFLCLSIGISNDITSKGITVETIGLRITPVRVFIEDTFIYDLLKKIEQLLPVNLSPVVKQPVRRQIPKSIIISALHHQPIRLEKLMIEPIRMDLSVHASLKLFLASDNSPLKFGRFDKSDLFVSGSQLAKIIAMHYASAALFRAGWVVGSLELIGSPTGLVRSIGTGVSDLFKMPYEGLTIGPGAFVGGVTRGFGSLLKNISSGTLTSITNFASSVSRNMDRLSLDQEHQQRQEINRRQKPSGVSEGLVNGLTGFGLSVLGAVAGLADQPLQTFTRESKSSATTGLVSGVGKGLVGIVTKPVGGAAELVSQTGIGLLQGTGLVKYPSPRVEGIKWQMSQLQSGRFKMIEKILHNTSATDTVAVINASQNLQGSGMIPCTLILTKDVLFIVDSIEDCQQQAFCVSEVECTKSKTKGSIMYVAVKSAVAETQKNKDEQFNHPDDRIQAFVKNVSKTALGGDVLSVSDNQSETSISQLSPAASFMYEFYVDKKQRDVFVDLYNMCKSRLCGLGFAI